MKHQSSTGTLQKAHRLRPQHQAFSLVELLVSMAVLAIFFIMVVGVTNNTFSLWKRTRSDLQTFENARAAYDILIKRISEATLNPYLDYYAVSGSSWTRRDSTNTSFIPTAYGRATDLDFRTGPCISAPFSLTANSQGHAVAFFAPLGYADNNTLYSDLPNLLNACTYFVEYDDGKDVMPAFLTGSTVPVRYRFRLKEIIQPSQNFKKQTSLTDAAPANDTDWISPLMTATDSKHPLAENIIALIIRPELASKDVAASGLSNTWSLTSDYKYNPRDSSKNTASRQAIQWAQLPPLLRVTMVAIDEQDAARVCRTSTLPNELKITGFTDPSKLDLDLENLEKQLSANKISYRVFSTLFPLRSAKWSGN